MFCHFILNSWFAAEALNHHGSTGPTFAFSQRARQTGLRVIARSQHLDNRTIHLSGVRTITINHSAAFFCVVPASIPS